MCVQSDAWVTSPVSCELVFGFVERLDMQRTRLFDIHECGAYITSA